MTRKEMPQRERAKRTRAKILVCVKTTAKTPQEVAKQIRNKPGPVAHCMKAMAARGELKAYANGTYKSKQLVNDNA